MSPPVVETNLPGLPVTRGKVRDVYDLGDRLLLVSTDRISAFDWILPTPIPDKGRVLTQVSNYWFRSLPVDHHLIETDVHADGSPRRRRSRRPRRPHDPRPQDEGRPHRVRRPRVSQRLGLGRVPPARRRRRHLDAERPPRVRTPPRAALHPRHQGSRRANTTRTSPSPKCSRSSASNSPSNSAS